MELERHCLGALDDVKRQGQGVLDCLTAVAEGLKGSLQSHIPQHIPSLPTLPFPSDLSFLMPVPSPHIQLSSLPSPWSWSSSFDHLTHPAGSRFVSDMKLAHPLNIGAGFPESFAIQHLGQDVSTHVGQAGAVMGAYLSDLAGSLMQGFSGPIEKADDSSLNSFEAASLRSSSNSHTGPTHAFSEGQDSDVRSWTEKEGSARSTFRKESGGHYDDSLTFQKVHDMEEVADEDVISILAQNAGATGSRSSAFVSTAFSSRTQDIETSVVARGDLWRVEATQGGTSTPLFLLQLGPILFVRASTLLLPVHLSKRHCLWYGFDRKEGLHSLCPAVWSKHRRWLAMAMLSVNPISCSFLDLQFPNGQMTYVAGEGLAGSAFTTAKGGLLQVQGRFPGDTKVSYSYKNKWGTRFTLAVLSPEKSASLEMVQPLAWAPVGVLVQPTLELSVTPTIGGRNPGTKVEVIHSPLEKFSWGCGFVESLDSKGFASVSLGRSKRNGEQVGSCGLTMQAEFPVKHIHPEVQKAGIRCLGLFGQLATKPTSSVVRQLRLSMSSGNSIVQNMAVKAVFDLILCHGATSLDRAVGIDPELGLPEPCPLGSQVPSENCAYGVEGDLVLAMRRPLLELLVSLLDCGTIYEELGDDLVEEPETPRSLVAEGFAKLLLQSKLFQDIQSIEDVILSKLLRLYFNDDLEISPRLQQCLSVFFNNYSVLSAANKQCVSKAFIPVMRSEWPGIYGNRGVSAAMISAKKRATQLSRFMLQLLQNPLLTTSQQIAGASDSSSPDIPKMNVEYH